MEGRWGGGGRRGGGGDLEEGYRIRMNHGFFPAGAFRYRPVVTDYYRTYLRRNQFFRRNGGRDHIVFARHWKVAAFNNGGVGPQRWGIPWGDWWAPLQNAIATRSEYHAYGIWDKPVGETRVFKPELTLLERDLFRFCLTLYAQKWEMTRATVVTPYVQHARRIKGGPDDDVRAATVLASRAHSR